MIEAMTEAELYAPIEWQDCSAGYEDILYHKSQDGIAKITINRPQVRNAFRPRTVKEMLQALADAHAPVVAVLSLQQSGQLGLVQAMLAVLTAVSVNSLTRTTVAFLAGGARFGLAVGGALALNLMVAWAWWASQAGRLTL